MSLCRSLLLVAGLAALPSLAQAETMTDRANRAAAPGPKVLRIDPDGGRFVRPRVAVNGDPEIERAIPLPHVMNGGGFGVTGSEYWNDATREDRLGRPRVVNEFILAPALRTPIR